LSAREVKALYDYESSPPPKITKRKTGLRQKAATPPLAVSPFKESQAKQHQQDWAEYLETEVEVSNSIGMQLRLVPPGEFTMGSPASEAGREDTETQHQVRITQPFYLSVHEVTQEQYERVMGNNPSKYKGANNPVEMVSWNDAVEFCRKLSAQEGVQYRLPTEAEWEYACRAGTTTTYSFGDDDSQLGKYAWYGANSGSTTHPVGEKLPNGWGLFDMHGNVWERCQDWSGDYGNEKVVTDPTGPASGSRRVLRGGAFSHPPKSVRAAYRTSYQPVSRVANDGFRLARTYDLSP
jgi:formylglycine-generating enzyme required for sulfatase activity